MINGINHITFAVMDLERSLNFYVNLLGIRLVAKWDKGAYLLAGNQWIALNIGVRAFKDNTSEGESFYFLDPDGHKLELHYNTIEDRLKWARENEWPTFKIV